MGKIYKTGKPLNHDDVMVPVEPIKKIKKDIIDAAKLSDRRQAKILVRTYYQVQRMRMASALQAKTAEEAKDPNSLLSWTQNSQQTIEDTIKKGLMAYAKANAVGEWMLSVYGIGPCISAGLLAHLNVENHPTAGHFWSYAGIINAVWEKNKVRPWNADLKVLVFKIGQSFMKFSGSEKCIYGHLYLERKAFEWERNLGTWVEGRTMSDRDIERAKLAFNNRRTYDKQTETWHWVNGCYAPEDIRRMMVTGEKLTPENLKKYRRKPCIELAPTPGRGQLVGAADLLDNFESPFGGVPMLPPGQIDARARRYAAKIFLSHVHHVMYVNHYGELPPKPFAIAFLNHAHTIEPKGFWFDRVKGEFCVTAPQAPDIGDADADLDPDALDERGERPADLPPSE